MFEFFKIRGVYCSTVLVALAILLSAIPAQVRGQDLNAAMEGYRVNDFWWVYGINNFDERTPVQSFGILGLSVPPDYIYVAESARWFSFVNAEIDGTTSIWWLLAPGYEIYPGQQMQVWVWVYGTYNSGRGGTCIAGGEAAVCAGLAVASW